MPSNDTDLSITFTVPAAKRRNVRAARVLNNRGKPAFVDGPEEQIGVDTQGVAIMQKTTIPNPEYFESDELYFLWLMGSAVNTWTPLADQIEAETPQPPVDTGTGVVDGQVVTITRKQGLKALLRAGDFGLDGPILESQIVAAINSMPEATNPQKVAKYDTLYEFLNAKTWNLNNQFTLGLQAMLGMDNAAKKALFNFAATFTE